MDEDDQPRSETSDAVLYDYFKHLTSLALLSLGGILALAENRTNDRVLIVVVLAAVGSALVLSFSGTGELVSSRGGGPTNVRTLALARRGAPMMLAVGLGAFLYIFLKGLFAT